MEKAGDGTCNAFLSREHLVLELVRAHFATFATETYFCLLSPHPLSRLRCIHITRRRFVRVRLRGETDVIKCDLVHEPILRIILMKGYSDSGCAGLLKGTEVRCYALPRVAMVVTQDPGSSNPLLTHRGRRSRWRKINAALNG